MLNKKNKEILTNFTPSNEYEATLNALASGSKISLDSLQKEIQGGSKWATNQFAKKALPSIEKLSEEIWIDNSDFDQTEIRNELINIIDYFGSVKEVQRAIIDIYGENKAKI